MKKRVVDIDTENFELGECFLPDHPDEETLYDEIYAILNGVQVAGAAVEKQLTGKDRVAVMQIADIDEPEFFDEMFIRTAFPLLVEYSTLDYLGERAHALIRGAVGSSPDWLADAINTSAFGVYSLAFNPHDNKLYATNLVDDVITPLHASALNVPLRDGDALIGRIFRTPSTFTIISPFVVPRKTADDLAKNLRAATDGSVTFMKRRGGPIVLRKIMAHLRMINAVDSAMNDVEPSKLAAVHDAWFELLQQTGGEPSIEMDGMCPDGTLFRFVRSNGNAPYLYRFLDVRARANVLTGGTYRESTGWLKLGCVPSRHVAYGAMSHARQVTSFTKVNRQQKNVPHTDGDLDGWLTTLFWVQQSIKNRSHELAA